MGTKSNPADAYYYAGGKRVDLAPAADLVAVPAGGTSVRVLKKDELGAAAGAAKSLYPVFRAHGAVMVALPEVRVEESRPAQWAKIDKWLEAHRDRVEVVSRDDDRVVLRPVSGSGEDALAIANELNEQVGPEMAQANFQRIVPRPG